MLQLTYIQYLHNKHSRKRNCTPLKRYRVFYVEYRKNKLNTKNNKRKSCNILNKIDNIFVKVTVYSKIIILSDIRLIQKYKCYKKPI